MIRLSQRGPDYWAQTVFQLSHEMCHFAIRQNKPDKDHSLSWLEETICEAVSLYALEYCSRNLHKCSLFKVNPEYFRSFESYLEEELMRESRNGLKECKTIEQLSKYEEVAAEKREERRKERNELYRSISRNPKECVSFLDLYQYLNPNKLTIDFETWKSNDPSILIRELEMIQPALEEGEYAASY